MSREYYDQGSYSGLLAEAFFKEAEDRAKGSLEEAQAWLRYFQYQLKNGRIDYKERERLEDEASYWRKKAEELESSHTSK